MKKNIFIFKKKNKKLLFILFLFLFSFLIYFTSFYINISQEYFIIKNNKKINYFIVPDDKEGEKVKFIDKKSINHISNLVKKDFSNSNIKDLNYTIQLFSDINYKNLEAYLKSLLKLKSEIISKDELFIFSINTQVGIDYFLTYKNFDTKEDALKYCKKLSFVKKCLIINPKS